MSLPKTDDHVLENAPSGAEDVPSDPPLIFTLDQWRESRAALSEHSAPLGIVLAADEPPQLIADDLERFAVICL